MNCHVTIIIVVTIYTLCIHDAVEASEHYSHCFHNIEAVDGFSTCYSNVIKQAVIENVNEVHGNDPKLLHYCIAKQIQEMLQIKTVLITDLAHFDEVLKYSKYLQSTYTIHLIDNYSEMEFLQHLIHLRSFRYQMYFLFCSFECASKILNTARLFTYDMCDKQNVWITLDKEIINTDIELPYHLLNIEQHFSIECDTEDITKSSCFSTLMTACSRMDHGVLLTLARGENRVWLEATKGDIALLSKSLISRLPDVFRVVTIPKVPYLMVKDVALDQIDEICVMGLACTQYEIVDGAKVSVKKCCYGLEIDLLKQLQYDMNFIADIYLVEDGYYGSKTNGTWNGLVADLKDAKADMALATLSINKERSAVIDFCETFADEHAALLTAAEERTKHYFNAQILAPFSPALWVTFLGSLVFIAFFLSALERIGSEEENHYYPVADSLSYLIALFVERSVGAKDPSILSSRVVSVVVALATITLIAAFTAALTADMVDTNIYILVDGLRDAKLRDPLTHTAFGMLAFSSWTTFFRDTEDEQLHQLYISPNKVEYKLLSDGMELMRTGKLKAIINDEKVLHDYACREKKVKFRVSKEIVRLIGMAIAIQKGSKLKEKISHYVRIYKEKGWLKKLENKWLQLNCYEDDDSARPVTVVGFSGAFFLLMFGILASVGTILLEKLHSRVRQGKPCSGFWIQ